MHNIQAKIEGAVLVIRVAVDGATLAAAPMSKSGKSRLVASSGGFLAVDGVPGLASSLNVSAK